MVVATEVDGHNRPSTRYRLTPMSYRCVLRADSLAGYDPLDRIYALVLYGGKLCDHLPSNLESQLRQCQADRRGSYLGAPIDK